MEKPKRTNQKIPPAVLAALDHVREFSPEVTIVAYGIDLRWHYMNENFEHAKFNPIPRAVIDIPLLEEAVEEAAAYGLPVIFQPYTFSDSFPQQNKPKQNNEQTN